MKGLSAAIASFLITLPCHSQSLIQYEFVGFTEEKSTGNAGISTTGLKGMPALNAMCATEFGANARVTTISEALRINKAIPAPVNGDDTAISAAGWLAPDGNIQVAQNDVAVFAYHSSGFLVGEGLSETEALSYSYCGRYSADSTSYVGPTLRFGTGSEGTVASADCGTALHVACSVPVEKTAFDPKIKK